MIEFKELRKAYNDIPVVDIPQLLINKGETIGLVGNNGAGKTTLFRLILDLIRPVSGEVLLNGENVAAGERWKNYTASFLDEGFLIEYLTPEEYFYFIGSLHELSKGHMLAIHERIPHSVLVLKETIFLLSLTTSLKAK